MVSRIVRFESLSRVNFVGTRIRRLHEELLRLKETSNWGGAHPKKNQKKPKKTKKNQKKPSQFTNFGVATGFFWFFLGFFGFFWFFLFFFWYFLGFFCFFLG